MSTSIPAEAYPAVVSAAEWEEARQRLLVGEKELTRARDALAAQRRRMPMVRVERDYRFVGPTGPISLLELFAGRRQLVVYRAFFQPGVGDWPRTACGGCSFVADHVPNLAHVHALDTTFVFASPAGPDQIAALQQHLGWTIPWVSLVGDEFSRDFGVDEYFGFNVFIHNDAGEVFRTYFVDARGAEPFTPTWSILDITPLGRQEEWEDTPAGRPQTPPYWWRLNNDYE